ncbi:MAG: isoprenyl transferase [Flavobacteriaceae bacterium]
MMEIDNKNIPKHIAVIMDGNGRWAKKKGKNRLFGHQNGVKALKKLIEESARLNISYLTLFAFSTENWKRPKKEISTIMRLIVLVLKKELKTMMDNKIKLETIGDLEKLPENVKLNLIKTVNKTKNNNKLTLTVAINYGGKEDISNAFKLLLEKVKNNIISPKKIDELIINNHLYTRNLPDVDLLIRTSGEQRISNFLLWKIAYAELYFSNVLWPDFNEKCLHDAIISYQNRERRFGKTSDQI